jgi:hypothetical protein
VGAGGSLYTTPPTVSLTAASTFAELSEEGALEADADVTLAEANLVLPVALWYAYDYLAQASPGTANEHWIAARDKQRPKKLMAVRASKPQVIRPIRSTMTGIGGPSTGLEVI